MFSTFKLYVVAALFNNNLEPIRQSNKFAMSNLIAHAYTGCPEMMSKKLRR